MCVANEGGCFMRVWLYYRLSRDEDPELNSLVNQRNILLDFAIKNNYDVVGESFDDNYSGMSFDRPGIHEIEEQLGKKTFDAVLVKDLSRLGRHRTETLVFIEKLLKYGICVISATENLDSSNENDDLMIGFKGMFNDFYARDISRKVRAGIYQKQKEGLVILPPMGYQKDPYTKEITINEEAADIVREIFDLYLQGYGFRAIAQKLNKEGKPTPSYFQENVHNRSLDYDYPEITRRYLWQSRSVKRVLTNESYCGTLINHKFQLSKINHTRGDHPEDTWIRHEDFYEPIVSRETWGKVQEVMEGKKEQQVRSYTNKACHKYSGLIVCGDCGSVLAAKRRQRKNQPERTEYVCSAYSRYGKEYCSSHRIDEEVLNNLIRSQLMLMLSNMEEEISAIDNEFKKWKKDRNRTERKLEKLKEEFEVRKEDQRRILLERIRDPKHEEVYNEMLESCEIDLEGIEQEITELMNLEETVKNRKAEYTKSIDLLHKIIEEDDLSNTNLRLLIEKIIISESKGKLSIKIKLNGNFQAMVMNEGEFLLHESLLGSACQNRILSRSQLIASKMAC